jgi:flagellar hook-associated protein 3 FlgL
MRVTNNSTFLNNSADLELASTRLAEWQRQVSSGMRVNAPSDDPSAASAGIRERNEIAVQDQYTEAADSATSRLSVVDNVLTDVLQRLTSVQTTILSARGTLVTPSQREAAAQELESLRSALASSLNTSFRGTYPFAGSAGTTPPFTQNPDGTVVANAIDQTPVRLDIDRNTSVQITYSAQDIAQGSDPDGLFDHLDRAIAAVRSGNEADMYAATEGVKAVFTRATAAQSLVGASQRAIEAQHGRISALRLASKTRISDLEGANLAEAISGMNQAETAYRAALGAISNNGRNSLMDYLR